MKSLYDAEVYKGTMDRLERLTATSPRQWGTMDVSQMLAHCSQPMRVATGEVKGKQSFIGLIFGRIAKKAMLSDKPFKQGLPTDKKFLVPAEDFEVERERLKNYLKTFHDRGPEQAPKDAHPFFGKMNADEWGVLAYKHLDHHLRQFAV